MIKSLTPKQLKVIHAVIRAGNIEQGCKSAKCAKSSFYRWMRNSLFKDEFQSQLKFIRDSYHVELKLAVKKAMHVIMENLNNKDLRVAYSVARDLIKFNFKLEELEIIKKLEKLEEKYYDNNREEN